MITVPVFNRDIAASLSDERWCTMTTTASHNHTKGIFRPGVLQVAALMLQKINRCRRRVKMQLGACGWNRLTFSSKSDLIDPKHLEVIQKDFWKWTSWTTHLVLVRLDQIRRLGDHKKKKKNQSIWLLMSADKEKINFQVSELYYLKTRWKNKRSENSNLAIWREREY